MKHFSIQRSLLIAGASLVALTMGAQRAAASGYSVHPLVTDDQAVLATLPYGPAPTVDPALINPWDATSAPGGRWVIADTGPGGGPIPGRLTVYTGKGAIERPPVFIPQGLTPPYGPTGLVRVVGDGFKMPGGRPARYIIDNLDGSISAWDGSSAARKVVPGRDSGGNLAIYTGLEVATSGGSTYLYAANRLTGAVDVFDTNFSKVTLAGPFVDPGPNVHGLVVFNMEEIGNHLWVTYATPGPASSAAPLGRGFVSEFNLDGTFVRRFATAGRLSSPWGIAVAPGNFGQYSNDVLIGNFNDGATEAFISAFDPATGAYIGRLHQDGKLIVLPGLWALHFGSGNQANKLFFTAGIGNENHGLFGEISVAGAPN